MLLTRKQTYSCALRVAPFCFIIVAAHANPNDSIQLTTSYSITHDDNLFHLSTNADAQATVGRSSAAETIKATTLGLSFIKDYGLQHVELSASAVNYDYQNFSYLSFTGFNYSGLVNWSLTPRIRGTVTADRTQSLQSFNDFQNYNIRNERIVTNTRADGLYELDGAWALTAAASRQSVENSATVVEQRAFVQQTVEAGVKRVFGSGSEAAYVLRKGSGDYSAVSFAAAAFLPSSFDTTENELRMLWAVSSKSQLSASLVYLQKKFNEYSFRDYSGLTARTTFNWGVTQQVNFLLGYSRTVGDYQASYANFTTTNRVFIEPTWKIKPKVTLKYHQEFSKRDYNGSAPGNTQTSQRNDDLSLARLSIDWQPREQIDVSAWIQQDKRDSTYANFNYISRSVGLLAQVSF